MRLRSIAVAFVGVLLSVIGGLYAVGWQLSRPVPARIGSPPADLPVESVTFASASGSGIRGWLTRGTPRQGAVVLLPGIRSNRLSMLGRARVLHAAGYSTLSIDLQATGESPGDVITFGWRERLDVLAAVQELDRMLPGEPIGIIGISLGGAATLLAASELDVDAVVLESVYPSFDVAVENRLRMRFGSLGASLSPLLLMQLHPRLGIRAVDLRPVEHIARLRCPVLVIGGAIDRHTTVEDTHRMYAAAREPKALWLVPDAGHVDFLQAAGESYTKRVLAFFEHALQGRPAPARPNGIVDVAPCQGRDCRMAARQRRRLH